MRLRDTIMMKILVACEFSQVVTKAFRERGHEAYSCDLLPCEGNHPEWHIQDDVLKHLEDGWDMMIAHPPCTYLANSGVHLLHKQADRWEKMRAAAEFFLTLLNAPIEKICVENPIMHKYAMEIVKHKPSQIIQPYEFGENASKRTCLWLKNLQLLKPTKFVEPIYACKCGCRFEYRLGKYGCPNCYGDHGTARQMWGNQTKSGQNKLPPSKNRWKERSKTYPGIAKAMAEQWG